MSASPPPSPALTPQDELEVTLAAVEARLTALGVALLESNAPEIDAQASELHRALARAVEHFSHAARNGALPAPLRERLMRASSQVAAQRESFARATAALDRAIDVLMPSEAPALYSAQGAAERNRRGGSLQA
ncbi:MAG: hypothetical protein M9915_05150 [Rhizobacter sp.]|jgi:hypothetical protein|nr:hypothetical protein [Burkholderiaceae bacterium]MCO5123113.1 hypothetical protein [Rhizobacter sp.]